MPVQDYENVIASHAPEIKNDPLQDLLVMPSDDVYVESRKRQFRATKSVSLVRKITGLSNHRFLPYLQLK